MRMKRVNTHRTHLEHCLARGPFSSRVSYYFCCYHLVDRVGVEPSQYFGVCLGTMSVMANTGKGEERRLAVKEKAIWGQAKSPMQSGHHCQTKDNNASRVSCLTPQDAP